MQEWYGVPINNSHRDIITNLPENHRFQDFCREQIHESKENLDFLKKGLISIIQFLCSD